MKWVNGNVFLFFSLSVTLTLADYWQSRAELIELDKSEAVGSSVILNRKENRVNKILMSYKYSEYDAGFENPGQFLAGQHFFKSKAGIEESEVFKFIQKLPKGASLHSHDTAIASQEYLFNLTYKDNLYGCDNNGNFILHFFNESNVGQECNWQPLHILRAANQSFDAFLKSKLTLIVDYPEFVYPNLNKVWNAFMDIFITVQDLIGYKPVWQEYFYQVLKELYEDNVMYLEFRGILPEIYDLEGNTYDAVQVVGMYYETLQQFKEDYPNFHGARFIYAPRRKVDNTTIDNYVEIFLKLREVYPDFIAGFDLVGQEDLGYPLVKFVPQLLTLKEKGAKFFFHAGETNWNGESTDLNLFDAVLLNTTRIGHGYAVLKHPLIQKTVKDRQIALEISPISNQVLKLVDDFRNHPGAVLISHGYPIVITSDDPSFWGAKGLSYDWYFAFMGMAGREDDLRFLKQLARNSIEYSAMDEDERKVALNKWEDDWAIFIDKMLGETTPIVIEL